MRTSGKEKTCPFSAASRNSANVGGRASQFGGHRFQMCVPLTCNVCNAVPACSSSRGRVVKVSRWKSGWKSETGRRAGRVMGRPSGLSPDTLACVHLSGQDFYENCHISVLIRVCLLFWTRATSSLAASFPLTRRRCCCPSSCLRGQSRAV